MWLSYSFVYLGCPDPFLRVKSCYRINEMYWRRLRSLKYVLLFSILSLLFIYRKFYVEQSHSAHADQHQLTAEEISKLLNLAEVENAARLKHLRKVCRAYQFGKYSSAKAASSPWSAIREPLPHYEVFYHSVKNKLSWCPSYKAASTTWLYHFATLGGATEEQVKKSGIQISTFIRKLYQPLNVTDAIKFLPSSLKFFVVRHPFERILSAYRDKLESIVTRTDNGTYFFYKKYGKKIVSKYRKGGNDTSTRSLLKDGHYLWHGERVPMGIEPTFKEFVRYLIDTNLILKADDHWIPFYVFCTPCTINYDVIAKVETMLSDQLLVIYKSGLQHLLKPHWRHKTNPLNAAKYDAMSEVAQIYFKQLSVTDVEELYEKYRIDFEMFQYKPDEYMNFVRRQYSNEADNFRSSA